MQFVGRHDQGRKVVAMGDACPDQHRGYQAFLLGPVDRAHPPVADEHSPDTDGQDQEGHDRRATGCVTPDHTTGGHVDHRSALRP